MARRRFKTWVLVVFLIMLLILLATIIVVIVAMIADIASSNVIEEIFAPLPEVVIEGM